MLRDSLAKFFKIDSLIENLTGYVETRVEILKVEAKEELSKALSNILVYVLLWFVFSLVLIFLSVAVAVLLAQYLGGVIGYSIVAGFYLVIGIILTGNRHTLIQKVELKVSEMLNKKKK